MAAGLYSELFTLLISLLNRYVLGDRGRARKGGLAAPSHPAVSLCPPQGAEVEPALGVLGDGGRHPRGAKPGAGRAEPGGHLRGALPQLRPGAPAAPLPPAHLRPRAGAIQGGNGDAQGCHRLLPSCPPLSAASISYGVPPHFLNPQSFWTGSSRSSSDTTLDAAGVSPRLPLPAVPLLAAPVPARQLCLQTCQAGRWWVVVGKITADAPSQHRQPRGTFPCVLNPSRHPASP